MFNFGHVFWTGRFFGSTILIKMPRLNLDSFNFTIIQMNAKKIIIAEKMIQEVSNDLMRVYITAKVIQSRSYAGTTPFWSSPTIVDGQAGYTLQRIAIPAEWDRQYNNNLCNSHRDKHAYNKQPSAWVSSLKISPAKIIIAFNQESNLNSMQDYGKVSVKWISGIRTIPS